MKWLKKKLVNPFYRRFRAVSRAGAHTNIQPPVAFHLMFSERCFSCQLGDTDHLLHSINTHSPNVSSTQIFNYLNKTAIITYKLP